MFALNLKGVIGLSTPSVTVTQDQLDHGHLVYSSGQNLIINNNDSYGSSTSGSSGAAGVSVLQGHLNTIACIDSYQLTKEVPLDQHYSSISGTQEEGALPKVSVDITTVIVSADCGSADSSIIGWNSVTCEPLFNWIDEIHSGLGVKSLKVSADGCFLFTLGADNVLSCWLLPSGSVDNEKISGKPVCSVDILPDMFTSLDAGDGNLISLTGKEAIQFFRYDRESNELREMQTSAPFEEIYTHIPMFNYTRFVPARLVQKFASDVKPVAFTATDKGDLLLWSDRDLQNLLESGGSDKISAVRSVTLHSGEITDLRFIDEKYMLTTGRDTKFKLYDFAFRLINEFDKISCGVVVQMCPQRIPGSNDLSIWRQTAINSIIVMADNGGIYRVTRKSSNMNTLTCDELVKSTDATRIVDVATSGKDNQVAIATSRTLSTWSYDGFIKSVKSEGLSAIKYSNNGKWIAVGRQNGSLDIVGTDALHSIIREPIAVLQVPVDRIEISSDDSTIIVSSNNGTVGLVKNQKWIGNAKTHDTPIFFMSISADGSALHTLGEDRHLVTWDCSTSLSVKQKVQLEQEQYPLAACWDNQYLLYVTNGFKFKWFNLSTGKIDKVAAAPNIHEPIDYINMTATHLVFASSEGDVGIHNLPLDGNPFRYQAVKAHHHLKSAHLSPDNQTVIAVGQNGMINLWQTDLAPIEKQVSSFNADSIQPHLTLVAPGHEKEFFKKCEGAFYYAQVQLQELEEDSRRSASDIVPIEVIPKLMQALGYFPSNKEIEDLQNQMVLETSPGHPGMMTLNEFIKLFANYRHVPTVGKHCVSESLNDVLSKFGSLKELKHALSTHGEVISEEEFDQIMERVQAFDKQESNEITKIDDVINLLNNHRAH